MEPASRGHTHHPWLTSCCALSLSPISLLRAPYPGSLLLPRALTRAFGPVQPRGRVAAGLAGGGARRNQGCSRWEALALGEELEFGPTMPLLILKASV